MKRLSILFAILLLAVLLSGCGKEPGKLEMDLKYGDSFDTSQTRTVDFNVSVTNVGELPCVVENIFSFDFWNTDEPGLTGNLKQEINREIAPGSTEIFVVDAYIWDADTIKDHLKHFAVTANLEDNKNCPQASVSKQGLIWLYK